MQKITCSESFLITLQILCGLLFCFPSTVKIDHDFALFSVSQNQSLRKAT